jgi:hypothetical protein
MSTTATHALNTLLLVDEHDLSSLAYDANLDLERDNADTSTFGEGDKTNLPGQRGGVLSAEFVRKGSADAYQAALDRALGNDTGNLVLYAPDGAEVGKRCVVFNSFQNSFSVGAPFTEAVRGSLSLGATGGVRPAIILNTSRGTITTTQNEVKTITATNVAAGVNGTLTLPATTLGAGGSLSILPGETAATLKTKLNGVAGYNDAGVTVTGTLALGSGANETHTLTATNVAAGSNATIYGTVTVTPGMTSAALQTAIRAKAGIYANVTVAGSTTAAGTTDYLDTATFNTQLFGGYVSNLTDASTTTFVPVPNGSSVLYNLGEAQVIELVRVYAATGVQVSVFGTNDGNGTTGAVKLADISGNNGWSSVASLSATAFQYIRYDFTTGGNVYSLDLLGDDNTSSGTYTITGFPANTNVADIEASPGTGWTGVVTQEGSAATTNGTLTVALAGALAQQDISDWSISGVGWSTSTSQNGGVNSSPSNVVNAAFDGASIDEIAATARGAIAQLHVVYSAGANRTLTVKIQHSANNTVWTDLVTFPALASAGVQRVVVQDGTTVNRYVRAMVAGGGITGNWAFTVALSRMNILTT